MCYVRPKQPLLCFLDDPRSRWGPMDVVDKALGGNQDIIELVMTGTEYY